MAGFTKFNEENDRSQKALKAAAARLVEAQYLLGVLRSGSFAGASMVAASDQLGRMLEESIQLACVLRAAASDVEIAVASYRVAKFDLDRQLDP